MSTKCGFRNAGHYPCATPTMEAGGFCEKHADVKCAMCGNQATHECHHDAWIAVCGAPLCDTCNHHGVSDK